MPETSPNRAAALLLSGSLAAVLLAAAGAAWAWGATGHRLIGRIAMESLPAELPAFLKTADAIDAVGEMAREPDRSKGAGQPHDADFDTSHFTDLTEDNHIYTPDGPLIGNMPKNRHDYDVALAKAGIDPFKAGHLYYSMLEGAEQLAKDFGYWRVETVILKRNLVPAHRAWIETDLKRREALIIRDLGYWGHFVGDASQPMHVSIHYNGWGDYPNPEGFTQEKVHGPFEGEYVLAHVTAARVRAVLPAPADCGPTLQACVTAYLMATNNSVAPFYRLEKAGAFKGDEGAAFAIQRIAAGAAMLRDLVVRAWRDSERQGIGYKPLITAQQVEAGTATDPKTLWDDLYGDD